jgi:hypothetical protein
MNPYHETKIPIGISNQYYQYFKLSKLKIVDVFAELIDNSISSCKKGRTMPIIDIQLNEDSIEITDNGIGFSEFDFQSAFITADSSMDRIGDSEFSVYGYGLKGSAFWLGNILDISTVSISDKQTHNAVCDLTQLPKNLSPVPTLSLLTRNANTEELITPKTKLVISEINSDNYSLSSSLVAELKECLGRVYSPMILNNKLNININSEEIKAKSRDYLNAFNAKCYKQNTSNKKYSISKDCLADNKPIEWKREVKESIIDESTKIEYSISGYIGLKPDQKESTCGIRVYRKNRGILGCNSRTNDFNPFNLQQGKPAHLFLIGDISVSDSFEKPLMGNDLPNKKILHELLSQFYKNNLDLFKQAHDFRVQMLTASFNEDSTEPEPVIKINHNPEIQPRVINNNPQHNITNNDIKPINTGQNRILVIENGYNIEFEFKLNYNKIDIQYQNDRHSKTIKITCDNTLHKFHKYISKLVSRVFNENDQDDFIIFINELNNVN